MSTGPNLVAPLEIGFRVTALETALLFWRDALSLTFVCEIETSERAAVESGFAASGYRVVRLELPTGERKLFEVSGALMEGRAEQRLPLARPGFAFVTLIVANLDAALAKLRRAGFPSRRPPCELRAGVFVALLDDPDGNIVELVQY